MAPVLAVAKYNLLVLGDRHVGKTSIITRFVYDKFDRFCPATIGLGFFPKTMYLGDRIVKLQLFDIDGSRFNPLNNLNICRLINNNRVALIVFDVTNRQTFLNASNWVEQVCTERGDDVIIVLLGSKIDLVDKRQVSVEEAEAKSRELNVMYIETSAKADCNIKPLFRKIVAALPVMEALSSADQEDMADANLE